MQDYIDQGHLSIVQNESEQGYFMPQHPVLKPSSSTTKVRAVFNASCKTDKGLSLNDVLMVGPTIQDKLFNHLLRFPTYAFVMTADIAQMYRQALVDHRDRKYQRLFWYDSSGQIKPFEMNTVTFENASATFLAIRTIQKLAEDESVKFPLAWAVLKRHFYVDDLLTGSNSLEEMRQIREQVVCLLDIAGFDIRKWV
ncbi:uncharacterized protein LOC106637200 [Copidosoma floridanum]|uniref:uncharacterized protein LOC106637200 n=1 Tax=Copidosoma floridanum TaxID=29053 RepID=UPI0006C99887|nr:uncharacterized protein LOC106637200 [Copidosoma floridanum]